jgi:glycosyltransferase involved in cell wall biosynthesis
VDTRVSDGEPPAVTRLLYVGNYKYPANDYRVIYGKSCRSCDVTYGLPAKPDGVDDSRYVHLDFGEGVPPKDLYNFARLWLLLWRHRTDFDLVHFYSTKLVLLGPLMAWTVGLPSLITVTGFGRSFSEHSAGYRVLRRLYLLLLRASMTRCRQVLFQNRDDLESARQAFPRHREKLAYIGSAMEMPLARPKDFRAPVLNVLLVTRLGPFKGVEDFLVVAERLFAGPFRFTLVGPRSRRCDELYGRVLDANRRGVIRYLGVLRGPPLFAQYDEAHLFFSPSYGEGMARVLIEAGLAGVCPVAYDISGNRDVMGPGRGFLVPRGDVEAVVAVLTHLHADRRELEANAKGYRSHVEAEFNMEVYTERLDGILERVVREADTPTSPTGAGGRRRSPPGR